MDEDVFFGRADFVDTFLLFLAAGDSESGSLGRSNSISLSSPRERVLAASLTDGTMTRPWLMGVNDPSVCVGATESL